MTDFANQFRNLFAPFIQGQSFGRLNLLPKAPAPNRIKLPQHRSRHHKIKRAKPSIQNQLDITICLHKRLIMRQHHIKTFMKLFKPI